MQLQEWVSLVWRRCGTLPVYCGHLFHLRTRVRTHACDAPIYSQPVIIIISSIIICVFPLRLLQYEHGHIVVVHSKLLLYRRLGSLCLGNSANHWALAASASQPLKSGTLSLHLSVPVPVLIPSVVTSRCGIV